MLMDVVALGPSKSRHIKYADGYLFPIAVLRLRACLNLFRPGWYGWNGTRLLVVVRSILSCLCPF